MGILLLYSIYPPYWFPAFNRSYTTQQDSVQISKPDKPQPISTRLYQGVYISKAGLLEALETEFTKYGIADQIDLAKKVIACESSWNIFADNGVSYGIAQFTPATWKDFGEGDIMNPYMQIHVMAKMWVNPLLRSRWNCLKLVK